MNAGIPKPGRLKKRSFSVAGHRTSIALEPEFWTALEAEARGKAMALAALVARIDAGRAGRNLASELRVHVLRHALEKVVSRT
ncbi:MAG TPA: ribbon-helix-helix domain-containing protein [Micropepsaceae bacterium]|nr:ribbon-helix-helix domain-containing protein [Micropepsaceae bacterium]